MILVFGGLGLSELLLVSLVIARSVQFGFHHV